MKITIIGSGGSGKSTLARKISSVFNVPRLEIDRIWFKYNGHKYMNSSVKVKDHISQKIQAEIESFLAENNSWVIDGTYSKIQPMIADRADAVVLIMRSLPKRILSHIFRIIKGTDRHPEVSKIQDLVFTKTFIRRWRNNEDSKLNNFAQQYKHKLVILKNFNEIDSYFNTLK